MAEYDEVTQRSIDRYREAYAAANGEEKAAELEITYNRGWFRIGQSGAAKNVRMRDLAQMSDVLLERARRCEEREKPTGPLEVTIMGCDDPLVFHTGYVRIACRHGIFRIKFQGTGLRISAESGSMRIAPIAANAVWLREE